MGRPGSASGRRQRRSRGRTAARLTVTPSQKGFFDELTYCQWSEPASSSLQISVSATDEAGLNVYFPPSWHSLNSRIAVDCTTTRITKAPSCFAYSESSAMACEQPPAASARALLVTEALGTGRGARGAAAEEERAPGAAPNR